MPAQVPTKRSTSVSSTLLVILAVITSEFQSSLFATCQRPCVKVSAAGRDNITILLYRHGVRAYASLTYGEWGRNYFGIIKCQPLLHLHTSVSMSRMDYATHPIV